MRSPGRILLSLVGLATAACVESTGTDGFYSLSQAQINLIIPVIAEAMLGPVFGVLPAEISAAALNFPIDSTTPCPDGGSIRLTGSVGGDLPGGTGSLTLGSSETAAHCAIRADTTTYTVALVPTLTDFGLIRYEGRQLTNAQILYMQGVIQVVNGAGQQSLCRADLIVNVTVATRAARVTGNICYFGVDVPATWAAPPSSH